MKWWRMVTIFMACVGNIVSTLMLYFVDIRSVLPPPLFFFKIHSLHVCKQKWQIHVFLPIPHLQNSETITESSCFHSSLSTFCKNLFSGNKQHIWRSWDHDKLRVTRHIWEWCTQSPTHASKSVFVELGLRKTSCNSGLVPGLRGSLPSRWVTKGIFMTVYGFWGKEKQY